MSAVHERKLIRDAVQSILLNHITEVGTKVYKSRAATLWPDQEMPCICISTKEDKLSERKSITPDITARTLFLTIEIIVSGESANDDVLDSIAKQIEILMSSNRNLNGTCEDRSLTDTGFGFKEDGDVAIAAARMTYEVEYLSKAA